MAPTLTATTSMHSSQLLSSSISSASSPRHSSSQISKIYRQASTLFLTRRLPESLSTILPVISPPPSIDDLNGNTTNGIVSHQEPAPIASASRTTRIKAWSLYLTILNAVVELDPDEGKQAFGGQDWRALVTKVRDGQVWEEVVNNGFGGVEEAVDSDIVINLATLLLAHARTQQLNQERLETYLAASTRPNLDISSRFNQDGPQFPRRPGSRSTGTDTPRDLASRVKILELYTLHVLLRNNEWEYARNFITMSSVLDEERREAFLAALDSLHAEQTATSNRAEEERKRQDEQLAKDLAEARKRREENEETESRRRGSIGGSEVDYGIDDHASVGRGNESVNGSTKARSVGRPSSSSETKPSASAKMPPPLKPAPKTSHISRPSTSKNTKKGTVAAPAPTILRRAGIVLTNLQALLSNLAATFKGSPMILLRTLAFIVGLLLLMSRNNVRERVKRMWAKILATAGMGVKVSYI